MNKLESLKHELEWRGMLKDIANEEALEKILEEGASFYIGIDPTADSLHIGHYVSIIISTILSKHGLKPVFVLGGFTGMIGDPSGKNSEREIIDRDLILTNVAKIKSLIEHLTFKLNIHNYKIVNNNDWYGPLLLVDYFQKYGKYFNVNTMINRDIVKNRLETGISYTEFSYQVFQGIDFYKLYKNYNVKLQLGGSDQWGNIVSGIELIRKIEGPDTIIAGMTINLLLDKNGNKIGKTNGNPVWIDSAKLSSYFLYQYIINLDDETALSLLPKLTLITEDQFNKIITQAKVNPHLKLIHHELAQRLFDQLFLEKEYDNALKISKLLFEEKYFELDKHSLHSIASAIELFRGNNIDETIINFFDENKITGSRREFREFLQVGALKINGEVVTDENQKLSDFPPIYRRYFFAQVGKKRRILIRIHL